MKKLLSILLITAFTGALCACGTPTSDVNAKANTNTNTNPVQTPDSATAAPSTVASAQQALNTVTDAYGFEGVITVVKNGEVLCKRATGFADAVAEIPADEDSLYCVGSVAKQFAATAILLLQERGKLNIDDKLSKYYPDCTYGDAVTLRQMLTMTSGIAEFYNVDYDGYNINEIPVEPLNKTLTNDNTPEKNREILQEWLLAQPLVFEPGSECEYVNSNYFLLARIVEQVSGKSYEDFMHENVFEPLGMTNTGFIDEMLDDPRLAKDAVEAKTVYVGITMGLGDIITNADDMEKWLLSFSTDDLLTAESKELMASDSTGFGYGFGVYPEGNGSWMHTGIFTSFRSLDYVSPSEKNCLFAVTNNESSLRGDLDEMCAMLAEEFF